MSAWKSKTVLVTGADGFIGSHVLEQLVQAGARVRAFALYNSLGRWGWIDELPPQIRAEIEVVPGDIRDAGRVTGAVAGCQFVFHLASLIAIPYSYHAPESYVETNVRGALNILNACRAASVQRLVHTSTSEVYGSAKTVPINESHPLQGQSPYSATKIGADMLAESYFRSFNLPVVIARPFNTFGPRQSSRAIIPTMIAQLLSQQSALKLGALSPTRDFTFVEDTARALLEIGAASGAEGEVINIGSGREISIGDLAALLIKITAWKGQIETDEQRLRPQNSEVSRLLCDATKLRTLCSWQPEVTLEEGLRRTVEWMSKHLDRYRPDQYVI